MWQWLGEHAPRMAASYNRDKLFPIRQEILARLPHLAHDISELRIRVLRRALELSGYARHAAEVLALEAFALFMDWRHEVAFFDGAIETLEGLRGQYRLGVITNGNADVRRMPVGRLFDFAISAGQLGISKPAPEVFQAAVAGAQCQAERMVHVGDHPEHDIAGAAGHGLRTVWINPNRKLFPGEGPRPNAEIRQLPELFSALETID